MRVPGLIALALVGCAPPQPDPVDLIRSGEVGRALPLLAEDPSHPLHAMGVQLLTLKQQGDAVRGAEATMLRDAAAAAIEAGDLARGATVLASARRFQPGNESLATLETQLDDRFPLAPPAARAAILLARSDSRKDPVLARELAREAAIEEAAARLEPEAFASVMETVGGATVSTATALLTQVDAEYHRPVGWSDCAGLAHRALERVRGSEGTRNRWPGISEVTPPPAPVVDLASAIADLTQTVAAYETAGVPEAVVVDIWVRSALSALDPWSRPVWAAEIATWEQGHAGSFVGVGLELEATPDGLSVVRPLLDSPSWTTGIHQGDRLLRIEDERSVLDVAVPTPDMLARTRDALRGAPGSTVRITVSRGDEVLTFPIKRGTVVVPTVHGWTRGTDNTWLPWLDQEHGIAYVRIDRFKPPTLAAFDDLLDPHLDAVRAVVIDLRGNPGGDVNAAVQIADRFVSTGRLAELSGRVLPETGPDIDPVTGEPLAAWNDAIPGHALEGVPVAVLVDADTASAAEVLAGALQEQAGATVVGEATWGKGEAQALRTSVEHGYAVQFTNVIWTLPSGRKLARGEPGGGGINPAVPVVLGPAERFQVDRAARRRSALRVHHDGTPMQWSDPGRREDLPPLSGDPVAETAALVLRVALTPATDG